MTTPPPPGTLAAAAVLGAEPSHAGAQPLVDDPKLGWQTSPANPLLAREPGGATRLATEAARAGRSASSGWLIAAVAALVIVAVAALAVTFEWVTF